MEILVKEKRKSYSVEEKLESLKKLAENNGNSPDL